MKKPDVTVRYIVLTWLLFLMAMLSFVAWTSVQLNDVRSIVLTQSKAVEEIKPLEGRAGRDGESIVGPIGPQGPQGQPGAPGQNAVSSTVTTIVEKPVIIQESIPVQGIQGIQGEKGEKGDPGREIELAKDEFGTVIWRYIGDKIWQELEVVQ